MPAGYIMFTGIIQKLGKVVKIAKTPYSANLAIDIGDLSSEVKQGGSVAVNGACLSAVMINKPVIEFDVVIETLNRTTLSNLTPSGLVNIELPLRLSDRLEGHFVQGHVDTTCKVMRWEEKILTLTLDDLEYMQYIIPKGSVTLDGVSLTIADFTENAFSVALIPTTLEHTTLGQKSLGDKINFEADILVKTIVKQQKSINPDEKLKQTLKTSGFLS